MQCVVLAGGLGTRMRPHTARMPKILLPVAGRPFADLQLTWLAEHGVDHVVLSIGHLGERVRQYVGRGERWGLEVDYCDDGDDPRGTGGALRPRSTRDSSAIDFSSSTAIPTWMSTSAPFGTASSTAARQV